MRQRASTHTVPPTARPSLLHTAEPSSGPPPALAFVALAAWAVAAAFLINSYALVGDEASDFVDNGPPVADRSAAAATTVGVPSTWTGLDSLASLHAPHEPWVHGHWVVAGSRHTGGHGAARVLAYVDRFRAGGAPVDAVILDAGWWDPAHAWRFHPEFYSDPDAFIAALRERGVRLTLWVSGIVAPHDVSFAEGLVNGFFVADTGAPGAARVGSGRYPPLRVVWTHGDAPSTEGSLIDFTNVAAVSWVTHAAVTFLERYPNISGFRVGGVDASLLGRHRLVGCGTDRHITREAFRRAYYRAFYDIGHLRPKSRSGQQRGDGPFVIVARAVDGVVPHVAAERGRATEGLSGEVRPGAADEAADVLVPFATRDALTAGHVGDYPFTFAGLRRSLLAVIHSATEGYGVVGTVIGSMSSTSDVPRGRSRETHGAAWNDALENSGGRRASTLALRWAQVAAWQPFMCHGGVAPPWHLRWTRQPHVPNGSSSFSAGERESDTDPTTFSTYAAIVAQHRLLRPYLTAIATRAYFDTLISGARLEAGERAEGTLKDSDAADASRRQRPKRLGASTLLPLTSHEVYFEEPVDWSFLLGPSLLVVPTVYSYKGATAEVAFPRALPVGSVVSSPTTAGNNDTRAALSLDAGVSGANAAVAVMSVDWTPWNTRCSPVLHDRQEPMKGERNGANDWRVRRTPLVTTPLRSGASREDANSNEEHRRASLEGGGTTVFRGGSVLTFAVPPPVVTRVAGAGAEWDAHTPRDTSLVFARRGAIVATLHPPLSFEAVASEVLAFEVRAPRVGDDVAGSVPATRLWRGTTASLKMAGGRLDLMLSVRDGGRSSRPSHSSDDEAIVRAFVVHGVPVSVSPRCRCQVLDAVGGVTVQSEEIQCVPSEAGGVITTAAAFACRFTPSSLQPQSDRWCALHGDGRASIVASALRVIFPRAPSKGDLGAWVGRCNCSW